jgi:hypothetical protein
MNLDLLRTLDPLAPDADLDPDGTTARRVRLAALAAIPAVAAAPRAKRRPLRVAVAATGAGALAAVALAVGLPGGGGGPAAPADARAALLSAAERTAAFTSGHITSRMSYDKPGARIDVTRTDETRFEGSDSAYDYRSTIRTLADAPPGEHHGGSRIVGGEAYSRDGDGPFRISADPHHGADAPAEIRVRVQAADALAAATRAASDVTEAPVDGGTRFTATVPADAVPDRLSPPFERTVATVAITATVGDDGSVRSIALRAPGEAVDVTFDALGEPQHIVAP